MKLPPWLQAGLLSMVVLGAGACDSQATAPGSEAGDAVAPAAEVEPESGERAGSAWPRLPPAVAGDPALEARIAELLARMTLPEKVGQIIQPEIRHVTPEDVKAYHLGAVLSGGGTTPSDDRHATAAEWVALADAFHHASMDTSDGGQAIPLLWGSDAVHGHNNVVGATLFPHNIGLGAARDPDLIRRIGAATAREVRATGLGWTFAPTVAVVADTRWGRTFESFAEEPDLVAEYARALVEGIQGEVAQQSFLDDHHVIAAAKHFLGDGGTHKGIDRGDTRLPEAELARVHGAGFVAALEAGAQTVMASFSSWNGQRLHGHRYLLSDVLKGRLGFDGFVLGDWNGHRTVPGCRVDSCPAAIQAGIDMLMVPADWQALYDNTLAQVQAGDISMARLDDAVTRILRVKMRAGLFEGGPPSQRALAARQDLIGHPDHRRLAREAVRRSLVLLKNNGSRLPLPRRQNVLVTGSAADDVARQSGGWTLTWQGTGTAPEDFPGATTIFEGIRQAVQTGEGEAVLSEGGHFDATTFEDGGSPDVAIVVFGEEPYAEWYGDLAGIEYQQGDKRDLALLRRLRDQKIPVVSVFLSGRPLWINKELNASDAFVAAWLPGSEGAGVADVLFRDVQGGIAHDFTGRLSFSWPRFVHQRVLNARDESYDPLFAYGYGLSYDDRVELAALPEDVAYPKGTLGETWLFVARAIAPWRLQLQDRGGDPVTVNGPEGTSGEGGNLVVKPADWAFEEDGRRFTWRGGSASRARLLATQPQDLSAYRRHGGALSLAVRVDDNPTGAVTVSMECGADCASAVSLEEDLRRHARGQWRRLSVDLDCFFSGGVDPAAVTSAAVLETAGRLSLSVADVKIVPRPKAGADIRCGEKEQGS